MGYFKPSNGKPQKPHQATTAKDRATREQQCQAFYFKISISHPWISSDNTCKDLLPKNSKPLSYPLLPLISLISDQTLSIPIPCFLLKLSLFLQNKRALHLFKVHTTSTPPCSLNSHKSHCFLVPMYNFSVHLAHTLLVSFLHCTYRCFRFK